MKVTKNFDGWWKASEGHLAFYRARYPVANNITKYSGYKPTEHQLTTGVYGIIL